MRLLFRIPIYLYKHIPYILAYKIFAHKELKIGDSYVKSKNNFFFFHII